MSNTTSEQLTFLELINKHKIEIPIIQRDYAQGRKGKEELRKYFLKALHEGMKEKPLELDFVYGSLKDNLLQPLDGQQRLTTLFLLHWYIAVKECKLDDNVKELLTKFTYETRISSREFCKELVDKGNLDFNQLLETDYFDKEKTKPKYNELSKTVKDSSWFFIAWEKDPTIKSMLTMLDSIHQEFQNGTDLWDKLNNISFQYIELQNFGLSDDLYIKMNARGKALTEFENFKAKFEQYIKKVIYKKNGKGEEIIENGKKIILKDDWEKDIKNPEETFSHKIDTAWTDLFWNYRGDDNLVDNEFEKFIAQIAINNYAQNREITENEEIDNIIKKELQAKSKGTDVSDEAIKRERIEKRIAELFKNPNHLKPEDFPNEGAFNYLKKCFDKYAERQNEELKPNDLSLWNYCTSDSTIFKTLIIEESTTYKQRVLFYAQTEYLLKTETQIDECFSDWLRVVRNIIQNSTIDSATTFIGAIALIKELSHSCDNIYKHLSKNQVKSLFATEQLNEEIRKAKLITVKNEIKKSLFELEETDFCRGTINWCLDCIDLENDLSKEKFSQIKLLIETHLNQNDISNWFRRAMLTISDNNFYNYWGTWSYGTETNKRCIIESRNDLKNNFTKGYWFKTYLKPLIEQLLTKKLEDIVNDYVLPNEMPNWKKLLIKEVKLLDNYCKGHFMGITNDNNSCYLFKNKKRPSSRDECEEVK